MHMYTWACLGGVDFEEEDQDTDQVKHVAGESENNIKKNIKWLNVKVMGGES